MHEAARADNFAVDDQLSALVDVLSESFKGLTWKHHTHAAAQRVRELTPPGEHGIWRR
jgi:hypothetical protein